MATPFKMVLICYLLCSIANMHNSLTLNLTVMILPKNWLSNLHLLLSKLNLFLSSMFTHYFVVKGPDRNCASPIKWCKWTVWIFWINFRHPMGSLEVLWCQFFIDQSHNILASQLLICWIFSIILHTKANPMNEPIRINLNL